ncbi:MAG TPA: YncE family protein [Terriglobales bacterium]|nr:YncE family protein [Terriglobales bacterium]
MKAMQPRLAILLILLTGMSISVGAQSYHVVNTYKLGGEGGWDYLTLDSSARRLYISRATHVIVVDPDNGKQIGDIADTPGVHGIALAPELNRGFTSNGRENTVSIFDLATLKTLNKIKVGENPDAILYDPSSKRVFTFNGRSADSSAIDAASGKVLGTIKLDGKPEFAVSDGKGGVFVNIEDKSELTAIDPEGLKVKATWPLAPCQEPSGLSMDREHRRLFSGCDKLMAVIDADSGKVVSSLPICDGVDATAYDDETKLAFASCHDGKLTVIREESPDKFSVVENAATQPGARTMALDPKTHQVYTVTAKIGPAPPASPHNPHPRPPILSDSFVVLVLAR